MPVMDGREATRRIKADGRQPAPKIIALTASSFEEERTDILSAGCDGFLRKPFREEDVFAFLRDQLGVQFMFESIQPVLPAPDPARLAALPQILRAPLEQALTLLDTEGIERALVAIGAHDNSLAQSLELLAEDYQYDRMLQLLHGIPEGIVT
jgi:CheY-like chemotaxis protein